MKPVPNGQERLNEARATCFKRAIVPYGNAPQAIEGMQVTPVKNLQEALDAI